MSSQELKNENRKVRMELKYCEHCGGLWLRECGSGIVYCDKCQVKVADLPVPKKRPKRLRLPIGPRQRVEDYEAKVAQGMSTDLEAIGGVA